MSGSERSGEGVDAAVDWTVLRSLLEAQSLTARAVEEYCMYATVDDAGDPEAAVVDARAAIERHRRIVEALELAVETAGSVDDSDDDAPGADR